MNSYSLDFLIFVFYLLPILMVYFYKKRKSFCEKNIYLFIYYYLELGIVYIVSYGIELYELTYNPYTFIGSLIFYFIPMNLLFAIVVMVCFFFPAVRPRCPPQKKSDD